MQHANNIFTPDDTDIETIIDYAGDLDGSTTPLGMLADKMSCGTNYARGFSLAKQIYLGKSRMAMVVILHKMKEASK